MKKETQQIAARPAPKGADLEKAEVWLRVEAKRRLEAIAKKENRSATKQALHYIELGMDGLDARQMAKEIAEIHAKLDTILDLLRKQ